MAIHLTDGDSEAHLPAAAAITLYGAIARQEWESAARIEAENPDARPELVAWGLISDEARPVACEPRQALRHKMDRVLDEARKRVELVSGLPDLSRELDREYQAMQLRAAGGSSVYLCDPAAVNARLQEVVGAARREILSAQPGGPRSRELFEIAVARDAAALDRGVILRTIYRDTVRDHAVTAEYAQTMCTRPSGNPAQYRTLFGHFERMIIVDRESAFVSDYIVEGSPPNAAWLVTDPAAVAVLARCFESAWVWAQPWMGELRPARGRPTVDPVSSADGVRTNARQREIMRLLCNGDPQGSIAKKVGCKKRTLEAEIADLKALWGVTTLNELIYQYAKSPDGMIDDSASQGSDAMSTREDAGLRDQAEAAAGEAAGTEAQSVGRLRPGRRRRADSGSAGPRAGRVSAG